MVALTGIERAKGQVSPVQLGLSESFYVELVLRRPGNMPYGRLASSLSCHLKADSSLNFSLPSGRFLQRHAMEVASVRCQGGR